MVDVSPAELEALLERGWRRFGPVYFRPACAACSACVPIRVPVERLSPNRTQRKALRRASHLEVELGPPRVDAERLALYARWHEGREEVRGWQSSDLDADEYAQQFAFPHPSVRELAFYEPGSDGNRRLIALSICDVTPNAWSAVYSFYEPERAYLSLGAVSVLRQAALAREAGLAHLYLGFWIEACASMTYKAGFRPHELLEGRPGMDEEPRWREAASVETASGS